ncbi:galactokinase [Paucibacter sp. M5-1]|uniref:galactokinase n=1 Tax=Paucibacter sp. M5-1 TaxID=3015998 RepID=UPI0022B8849F|nr:galactokinase [Paucibacter sp. M5-1]MCZ7883012.1 galactokinase [Paucibacter sp. M5-1]
MTTTLEQRVRRSFAETFSGPPDLVVQAPGRVNLIGEHTDYNDGFVLPCAINFATVVGARMRPDRLVRVLAVDQGGELDEFLLDEPLLARADSHWSGYVRGMVWALQGAGFRLCGADLVIAGDVPQGAGLSSSASLELAIGQAFKQLLGLDALTPARLALLAQKAENEFVGCRCGIMDQMISACGVAQHALLLDCRSLETRAVPLPTDLAVLIINSNVRRGLVDSEYNLRREQCEAAARHFGVKALRDLDSAQLGSEPGTLDALVWRRARHVVSENARTLSAAEALAAGDLNRLGVLMAASHASMRDDFEITTPAIDQLVALIAAVIGTQGGVRMTGGGFGGCVVALTTAPLAALAMQRVAEAYRSPDSLPGTAFLCRAADGAGLLATMSTAAEEAP